MATADLLYTATTTSIPSSTLAATAAAATSFSISDSDSTGECRLLGPFAILVQGALGALALLSLVYKRWRERPQRPLKIWSFDVSKQVVGSILLHLANLVMSMFSAGQISRALDAVQGTPYQPNPCSFYLLNLAIDTTLGIPILIILLRVLHAAFRLTALANPPESIQSGNYGSPPRYTWWMKQSLIYFLGLLGMKFCVFILFALFPWLGRVGDWALEWTEGNEALQVAFVMLIFPLIMNALQYYIIDTFIKKGNTDDDDSKDDDPSTDPSHPDRAFHDNESRGLLAGHDEDGAPIDTHADYLPSPREDLKPTKSGSDIKTRWASIDTEEEENLARGSSSSEPSPKDNRKKDSPRDNLDRHEEDKELLSKVPKPTE